MASFVDCWATSLPLRLVGTAHVLPSCSCPAAPPPPRAVSSFLVVPCSKFSSASPQPDAPQALPSSASPELLQKRARGSASVLQLQALLPRKHLNGLTWTTRRQRGWGNGTDGGFATLRATVAVYCTDLFCYPRKLLASLSSAVAIPGWLPTPSVCCPSAPALQRPSRCAAGSLAQREHASSSCIPCVHCLPRRRRLFLGMTSLMSKGCPGLPNAAYVAWPPSGPCL